MHDDVGLPVPALYVRLGRRIVESVPPGAVKWSGWDGSFRRDSHPPHLTVTADQNLLVSVYLPKGADPWHELGMDTSWVAETSETDKHVGDDTTAHYNVQSQSTFVLAGVDVISPTATGTIVAIGDSITDGYNSTRGANRRWPDHFARLLNQNPGGTTRGVVNVGISANTVFTDRTRGNPALTTRFKVDVLRQTNVSEVVLLEGINDIAGFAGSTPADRAAHVKALKNGLLNVINQAHAAGVKIIGCTILPWRGTNTGYTDFRETIRQEVNDWIRTGNAFDFVVDLDLAVRDPGDPHAINPSYLNPAAPGDRLHPGDAGYQRMADAAHRTITFP